jgi:hypothetical protein
VPREEFCAVTLELFTQIMASSDSIDVAPAAIADTFDRMAASAPPEIASEMALLSEVIQESARTGAPIAEDAATDAAGEVVGAWIEVNCDIPLG